MNTTTSFYKSYPALGTKLGLRSTRKDTGILNLTCRLRFTGLDEGQTANVTAQFQNHPQASKAAEFTGWAGLMLGRKDSSRRSSPLVRTFAQYNRDTYWSTLDLPEQIFRLL